jgi:hypothetical protein
MWATESGGLSIAPRICQRALVRPRSAVSPSPAASRHPFNRKVSRINSVRTIDPAVRLVWVSGVLIDSILSKRQYIVK